jgi:hypothetical protein
VMSTVGSNNASTIARATTAAADRPSDQLREYIRQLAAIGCDSQPPVRAIRRRRTPRESRAPRLGRVLAPSIANGGWRRSIGSASRVTSAKARMGGDLHMRVH